MRVGHDYRARRSFFRLGEVSLDLAQLMALGLYLLEFREL
jgi:hypothetical protein